MGTGTDMLQTGRAAFARYAWQDAFANLSEADAHSPLGPGDLEQLGMAAYLLARDADAASAMTRAYQGFLSQGDPVRAVRCAFWLSFGRTRAERARASGWLAKARRLLDAGQHDCVERGYLLLPEALGAIARSDFTAAYESFVEADRIGERFRDIDLVCMARQGRGRMLIRGGDTAHGVALLDEVMVSVTAGEVSPAVAGTVYCSVIEGCFEICDLGRAQEWTGALTDWCASQPEVVPYRGHCLVRRAEIMLLHGAWPDAIAEAQQACERLSQPSIHPAVGGAFYVLAELYRLTGDSTKAEEAYRRASDAGRNPHPGLALLRLAQSRVDAARTICAVSEETPDRRTRAQVLSACVEIQLAAGDIAAAKRAAQDLGALERAIETPYLQALSSYTAGAVQLAEGDPKSALRQFDRARQLWRDLEIPYEAARASTLIGLAYRALGDLDTSAIELETARRAFKELGAEPDLRRIDELARSRESEPGSGLTTREVQVLQLVARGTTNRGIARELGISEKTVARHMSNIFTKLDLSSRAAATAYAFKHHLV
jgi:DNA-binding CsgD family transcriptional regulator